MRTKRSRPPRSRRPTRWSAAWITGALVLVLASAAPAQDQPPQRQRGMDPAQRMERLKERLQLTDEQVAALEPIFAEHDQLRRELLERQRAERQAMREEMSALRLEMDEEIAEVLTEEQMQEFRTLRQQMMQKSRRGRPGGPPAPPPPPEG